jgi:hypothetical protein
MGAPGKLASQQILKDLGKSGPYRGASPVARNNSPVGHVAEMLVKAFTNRLST